MSTRKDYTIDVLRLLEKLKDDIGSKRSLGSIVFGLDKTDLCFQIDQIRAAMPREVKDAASLTRETERIKTIADEEAKALLDQAIEHAQRLVNEAEAKAANLLQQAELKQTQMVDENEILRIAKSQAEEMRKAAERDAREMRRGADHYATDVLTNLEGVVGKVLSTVERGRKELEAQQIPVKAVVEVPRERVKA
jgi:cell division septum initiation protein DivIVA